MRVGLAVVRLWRLEVAEVVAIVVVMEACAVARKRKGGGGGSVPCDSVC